VRLATFNILNGRSPVDGRVDLERFAAVIRVLDPDVLGLQEVDSNQSRSHGADLTEVAADAMAATDHRFVAALDGTPGARWIPVPDEVASDPSRYGQSLAGHPLYGIALLSRFPVLNWDVLRLPITGPHFPFPVPGARRSVLVGEEPRSAVIAEVDTPAGPLLVANAHLSFLPGWNVVQLRRIVRRLDRAAGPALIMGDMNLPAVVVTRLAGFRPLATRATFPVSRPVVQLDHLLLRGELGPVRHVEAIRLPVSDHRALVVDLGDQ
jgi:endonuclease/exonuclease/phosphatase family metal-dependent hydrolase